MSVASRRRRRRQEAERYFQGRGEPYFRSTRRVPPAQERVRRSFLEAMSAPLGPGLEELYRGVGALVRRPTRLLSPPPSC